ncbi:hypothetical protein [Methylorubrum extorquens]
MNASVEAYLAGPGIAAHPIADRHGIDFAAALAAHRWASQVDANFESTPA